MTWPTPGIIKTLSRDEPAGIIWVDVERCAIELVEDWKEMLKSGTSCGVSNSINSVDKNKQGATRYLGTVFG